ncbi:hypothetical protein BDZ94DRAFT_1308816 [Collybia nuda]|uniref:Uncharacterized protein n=1 Tax=Collybia nuda TaxID=64659 RepID=A0A9P5Y4S7_9AGAR|nr:hypothetical protein BDZ94DRAFT_1308816 [Collybia nuda]
MSRKQSKANLQIHSHSAGDDGCTHSIPTEPVVNIPVSRFHSLPSGNLGRSISYQSVVIPQDTIASQSSDYPSYDTSVPELNNSSTQLPQDEPWFDPAYIEHLDQTDMAPRQTRISDNPLKRWIPDQDTFVAEDI